MPLRKVSDLQQLALSSVDFSARKLDSSIVELSYRRLASAERGYSSVGMNFVDFAKRLYVAVPSQGAQLADVSRAIDGLGAGVRAVCSPAGAMREECWHIYVEGRESPVVKTVLTSSARRVDVKNCDVVLIPGSYHFIGTLSSAEYDVTPDVLVYSASGQPLIENLDYAKRHIGNAVSFEHDAPGVLTASPSVEISGLNTYYGSETVTYPVEHEYYIPWTYPLSDALSIMFQPSACAISDYQSVYEFKDVRPVPEIVMSVQYRPVVLIQGQDYTVRYFNNTSSLAHDDYGTLVLSSVVELSGLGNFTGVVSVDYPLSHTYMRKPCAYFSIADEVAHSVASASADMNLPENPFWNISCVVSSWLSSDISNYVASINVLSPDTVSNAALVTRYRWPDDSRRALVAVLSSSYAGPAPQDYAGVAVSFRRVTEDKTQISSAAVALTPDSYELSGAWTPYEYRGIRPKVSVMMGGRILSADVDYVVEYFGDSGTFAPVEYGAYSNEASVIVEGVNTYAGFVSAVYPITYVYHSPYTQYAFSAVASDYTMGTVGGTASGQYDEGTEVSVFAQPLDGYAFVKWVDTSGMSKSTDAEYVFRLTADTELTAEFTRLLQ